MRFTCLQAVFVLSFVVESNSQAAPFGQCGGGSVGSIGCMSGYCCQFVNEFYSQCLEVCTGSTPVTTKTGTSAIATKTSSVSVIKSTTSSKPSTTKSTTSSKSTTIKASTSRKTTVSVSSKTSAETSILIPTSKTSTSSGNEPTGLAAIGELVGYGGQTTGGGTGSGTTVTTCEAFIAAVANGGVIKVIGILSGCGLVRIPGNTSILGVGANSGFVKTAIKITTTSNVILRNLKFYSAMAGGDLVAIERASNVWVDHCELFNDGIVGDKDFYDGLLDVVLGSDFITISWCKFHDHWKGSLIGSSDTTGATDTGKFHVTYHHNSFINIFSRLPSNRFGSIHVYNCCYKDIPTSAIHSRMGGQVLVENSSFTDVNRAIVTDYNSPTKPEEGFATQRGNLFLGLSPISISQDSNFVVPYLYQLDPVDSVCERILLKAGTGIVSF